MSDNFLLNLKNYFYTFSENTRLIPVQCTTCFTLMESSGINLKTILKLKNCNTKLRNIKLCCTNHWSRALC